VLRCRLLLDPVGKDADMVWLLSTDGTCRNNCARLRPRFVGWIVERHRLEVGRSRSVFKHARSGFHSLMGTEKNARKRYRNNVTDVQFGLGSGQFGRT